MTTPVGASTEAGSLDAVFLFGVSPSGPSSALSRRLLRQVLQAHSLEHEF